MCWRRRSTGSRHRRHRAGHTPASSTFCAAATAAPPPCAAQPRFPLPTMAASLREHAEGGVPLEEELARQQQDRGEAEQAYGDNGRLTSYAGTGRRLGHSCTGRRGNRAHPCARPWCAGSGRWRRQRQARRYVNVIRDHETVFYSVLPTIYSTCTCTCTCTSSSTK